MSGSSVRVGEELGGYRIESPLGRGGTGTVYRATQLSLGRPVALKLLSDELAGDPEARQRFFQEGRLAARISHPSLVQVLEVGEAGGRPFLVYELILGETLRARLRRVGTLSVEETLVVGTATAGVLRVMHAAGVLHRDLKPENIFMTEDRGPLVGDLGIAKDTFQQGIRTQFGLLLGTPEYMAPEVVRGEPARVASDLYALAIVLYECLRGVPPFQGDEPLSILSKHLSSPVPSLRPSRPDIPERLERVVSKALLKEPQERFRDSAELAQALEACAKDARERAGHAPPRRTKGARDLAPGKTLVLPSRDSPERPTLFAANAHDTLTALWESHRLRLATLVAFTIILVAATASFWTPSSRKAPQVARKVARAAQPAPPTPPETLEEVPPPPVPEELAAPAPSRPPPASARTLARTRQLHSILDDTEAHLHSDQAHLPFQSRKRTKALIGIWRKLSKQVRETLKGILPEVASGSVEAARRAGWVMDHFFSFTRSLEHLDPASRARSQLAPAVRHSRPKRSLEEVASHDIHRFISSLPSSLQDVADPVWCAGLSQMIALSSLVPKDPAQRDVLVGAIVVLGRKGMPRMGESGLGAIQSFRCMEMFLRSFQLVGCGPPCWSLIIKHLPRELQDRLTPGNAGLVPVALVTDLVQQLDAAHPLERALEDPGLALDSLHWWSYLERRARRLQRDLEVRHQGVLEGAPPDVAFQVVQRESQLRQAMEQVRQRIRDLTQRLGGPSPPR